MRRNVFLGTLIVVMLCLSLALCGSSSPSENLSAEETNFVELIVDAPNTLNYLESVYSLRAVNDILDHEEEGGNVELLYNANDEAEYILATADEGGYAIFHRMTGSLMEAGEFGPSPYEGQTGKKYYFGPSNYAVETANGAKTDIMRGGEMTESQLTAMHRNMAEIRSLVVERSEKKNYNTMLSSLQIASNEEQVAGASIRNIIDDDWVNNPYEQCVNVDAFTEIDHSDFYKIMTNYNHFGYNSHGSCIFVTTVLLLRYYDMFVAPGLLPNETIPQEWIDFCSRNDIPEIPHWEDEDSEPYSCEINDDDSVYEAAHKYLIALEFQGRSESSSNPAEFGYDGYNVLKYNNTLPSCTTVCNYRQYYSQNTESSVFNTVKSAVDLSNPIAITIKYKFSTDNDYSSHAILTYGYLELGDSKYYKAHMGWENCSSIIVPSYFASGKCNFLTVADSHSQQQSKCGFSECASKTSANALMTCFASNGHPMVPSELGHKCEFCDVETTHSGIGLIATWQDYTDPIWGSLSAQTVKSNVLGNCFDDQYHLCCCKECIEYLTGRNQEYLTEGWWAQVVLWSYGVLDGQWQYLKAPHSWGTPNHSNGCLVRCTDCGYSMEHTTSSYRYVRMNFAKHQKICTYCGETVEEAHKLVQGQVGCILCGFGIGGNVSIKGVN